MTSAYITHPQYLKHENYAYHPERPGRIQAVWDLFQKMDMEKQLAYFQANPVTEADILRAHTNQHLSRVREIKAQAEINGLAYFDADTYMNKHSYDAALLAAGALKDAVDLIFTDQVSNALCAVRPPGHHATPDHPMGFCLFNNVAIAARYAQSQYQVERVLIIDIDVHHGNGTQDIFYDDPSVLFISTHQFPFYPGSGSMKEIGSGQGASYTLNIPLAPANGDENYLKIFDQLIYPKAKQFKPEIVIVSAGFDAHWNDPLAMMGLSLPGYARLTQKCKALADELCDGKIIFAMEGGYDINVLSHGMLNIAYVLQGKDELSDPFGLLDDAHEPDIDALIQEIAQLHQL
ncbi:histone deacetylase [Anaerolineales bacterium]